MATRKFKMAKLKAHIQSICDLIDESDASMVDGKDGVLNLGDPEAGNIKTPESEGAMDSRRGTQSMRTAFGPNYDRLKKL